MFVDVPFGSLPHYSRGDCDLFDMKYAGTKIVGRGPYLPLKNHLLFSYRKPHAKELLSDIDVSSRLII